MYSIDRAKNAIHPLTKKSFSDLKFREREHLQEWLANEPTSLGEILIIQKEFSSWDNTRERLDLLAIDATGRLVIIENKLDDSGKDVTWQALKYAAYCSTLKTAQIVEMFGAYSKVDPNEAREIIAEFVDGADEENLNLNPANSQRIILVAAKFRLEVTATALWLIGKGLDITCVQVTPFERGEDLFLSVDQIIPVPEASDYMVRLAEKSVEEENVSRSSETRNQRNLGYWTELLDTFNENQIKIFQNRNSSKDHWLNTGSGTSGLAYTLVLTMDEARSAFTIERASKHENKAVFDFLSDRRDEIESAFGDSLIWRRLNEKKSSTIWIAKEHDATDRVQWPEIIAWHQDTITRLEKAIQPHLSDIGRLF